MESFSEEVKQAIVEANNGYCAKKGCYKQIHSIHHKNHNTKANRIKYPLFIDSPFNAVGLCFDCHSNFHYLFEINDSLAEVYESYLQKLRNT